VETNTALTTMEVLALMESLKGNINGQIRDGAMDLAEPKKHFDELETSLQLAHQDANCRGLVRHHLTKCFHHGAYTHLEDSATEGTDVAWLHLAVTGLAKLGLKPNVEYRFRSGLLFGNITLVA
jgi:hypothetical protein